MLSSLRFRLPALFLLGIVVSGLIAAVVALRLFQGYVLNRSKADLRREAIGLTEVFAQQAIARNDTGVPLPRIARQLWKVSRFAARTVRSQFVLGCTVVCQIVSTRSFKRRATKHRFRFSSKPSRLS